MEAAEDGEETSWFTSPLLEGPLATVQEKYFRSFILLKMNIYRICNKKYTKAIYFSDLISFYSIEFSPKTKELRASLSRTASLVDGSPSSVRTGGSRRFSRPLQHWIVATSGERNTQFNLSSHVE